MTPLLDTAVAALASLCLGGGDGGQFPPAPLADAPIRFAITVSSESRPSPGAEPMPGPPLKVDGLSFRGRWVLEITPTSPPGSAGSAHPPRSGEGSSVGFDGEVVWHRVPGQPVVVSRNRSAALTPSLWWFPALVGIGDRYDGTVTPAGAVWTPLKGAIVRREQSTAALTVTAEWRDASSRVGQRDSWEFQSEGSVHSLVRVHSQLFDLPQGRQPTLHSETLVVLGGAAKNPDGTETQAAAPPPEEDAAREDWIEFGTRRMPSRLVATGRTIVEPPDLAAVAESVLTLTSIERVSEAVCERELDRFFMLGPGEVLIDTERALTIQQGTLMFSLDDVVYVAKSRIVSLPSDSELDAILETATAAPTQELKDGDAAAPAELEPHVELELGGESGTRDGEVHPPSATSSAARQRAAHLALASSIAPASRVDTPPPGSALEGLNIALLGAIAAAVMGVIAVLGWVIGWRVRSRVARV